MAENSKCGRQNYCALPFNHTVVDTQGNFMPCCHHYIPHSAKVNVANDNYEHWLHSPYMQQVQQAFQLDQRHPGCGACWELEDRGFASPRMRSQKEYQILKVQDLTNDLVNIEIQLGNLCNLKCLMCDETGSSQILAENHKLGIAKHEQKDFNWSEESCAAVEKMIIARRPKILTLRGGEPLYNRRLLELINSLPPDLCQRMMLIMVTNATVWSDAWRQSLSKFRLVKFVLSIDATHELYEYIRYPADWQTVQNNVDQILQMPSSQHLVNAVVQNLNICRLGDLINWCSQRNLYLHLHDIVRPHYLQTTNLPPNLQQQAIQHLEHVLSGSLPDYLRDYVINLHRRLVQHAGTHDQALWQKFQTIIGMRDSLRGNSHVKFMAY